MRKLLLAVIPLLLSGQSFEVASVKTAAPLDRPIFIMKGGPGSTDPGQFTCFAVPLHNLVLRAFGIRPYQLSSARSLETDKYDIVAKVPAGASEERFRIMLQNLLAERIGLKFHHETKDLPAFDMVIAKGGVKLKPAEVPATSDRPSAIPDGGRRGGESLSVDKDGKPQLSPGRATRAILPLDEHTTRISARMQDVEGLLGMMRNQSGYPVTDKTGLTGKYDFNLDFARDPGPAGDPGAVTAPDPVPNFFMAIQQQLGLKLEPKKEPADVLVIDSWSKVPVGN